MYSREQIDMIRQIKDMVDDLYNQVGLYLYDHKSTYDIDSEYCNKRTCPCNARNTRTCPRNTEYDRTESTCRG